MRKIIIILILVILLSGCAAENISELGKVQVRDYEGQRLDLNTKSGVVSIKGTQYVNISDYHLQIKGLVNTPKNLTYEEVLAYQKYKKVVELHCVEGWTATHLWEGVLVRDLIDPKPEANTVIFYAYDGYTTSLPLKYFYDKDIIMAYKLNNITLPPANGFPFQLVAEDKYGIKWIRWITKIELSNDTNFRGYWERGGYNNDADVGGPIFEK